MLAFWGVESSQQNLPRKNLGHLKGVDNVQKTCANLNDS